MSLQAAALAVAEAAAEAKGSVLSLNDVPYDRDLKWSSPTCDPLLLLSVSFQTSCLAFQV